MVGNPREAEILQWESRGVASGTRWVLCAVESDGWILSSEKQEKALGWENTMGRQCSVDSH